MTVAERVQTCRLLEMMKGYRAFCKEIGIEEVTVDNRDKTTELVTEE